MPKFDLLLLPLLGGYIFLITFNLTKFYHQRIERQRLIFNTSILAFFISIVGLVIDEFVLKTDLLLNCREFLGRIIPIEYSGLNQSILIFAISYPLAKLLNWIISDRWMLNFVVYRWGDDYEKLFWSSMQNKKDEDKLIMLSTKTNKVYIGIVNWISEPIGTSYISIIPHISGYRDKETQTFNPTTDYLSVLQHFIDNDEEDFIDEKMGVYIPKDTIILASRFDYRVFDRFSDDTEGDDELERQQL